MDLYSFSEILDVYFVSWIFEAGGNTDIRIVTISESRWNVRRQIARVSNRFSRELLLLILTELNIISPGGLI